MQDIKKYIFAFLGLVLLGVTVWYFSNIVAYILISVVLSFIGRPLVEALDVKIGRVRIPRALAAGVTLLVMWTVFILFFYYLTPLVVNEFGTLREIDYAKVAAKMEAPIERLNAMLTSFYNEPIDVVKLLGEKLSSLFTSQNTVGVLNSLTGRLSSLFVALFSITFMTFFFLKDSGLFMKGVLVFTPEKHNQNVNDAFVSIKKLLVRYFLGVFLEVITIFVLLSLGLSIIGIPFHMALVVALLAATLNIIPYIGPLVGVVMGVLIVLLNHIGLPMSELLPLLGFTAMIFAIVQLIDNILLQPFIYSSSVFAHPLEIFLLILVAGSLAGPVGMILAVPAYTILRVVGYEFFAQYEVVKRLTKGISNERKDEKGAAKSDEAVQS